MADDKIDTLAKHTDAAIKRLEDALANARASLDAAKARIDKLEHALQDIEAGQGVASTMPPLFAAMVHAIHRGDIAWDVEEFGVGHEVVDCIGTARAHATIMGVPINLMRVVDKKTRRAGYIATRPDGDELVFRVASANGRLLKPRELDDPTLALTDDETRAGAAARLQRDADRKAAEDAAIKAELQRRGARP